ncbi:hypothetical protein JL722_6024 [Aureococcus anophagefferens]|nr:hypothetical protein JL722_6024 [Aureococcus anophagefferens]
MASPERKKKKKGAKDAATPPASREASAEPRGRSEKKDKKDKKKKKDKSASKEGRSKSKDKKKGKKDRSASKGKKKGVQEEEPAKENKVEEAPKEPLVLPDRCGEEDRLRTALMTAFDGDEKELAREIETMPTFVSPCGVTINWIPANSEWTTPVPVARPTPEEKLLLAKMPRTRGDGLPRFATGGHDRKGVERCWLLLRCHFEPFTSIPGALGAAHHDPPHHETDKDRAATKIHALFHRATRTAGGNRRGMLLKPRRVPLHRLFRFLEYCGETFEGGFPYDKTKWAALQELIRKEFNVALADSAPDPDAGPASPRAAALMAHGVAMGRLYLVAHLDAHACNAPDEHGDRPLAIAAMGERPKAILALLSRGAWPSAPSCSATSGGATALHYAAATGNGVVRQLLAAGADPNATTTSGETPLHYVSRLPRERGPEAVEVARVLMDHGASPDGFADERNAHAEPPPPPPAEEKDDEDKGKKGKKKGSSSKKASKGSSKKAKKEEKNDDEPPPPPPPDPRVPDVAHLGHRATGEPHAARFTPLQCAAAAGHGALLNELLRRGANAGVKAANPGGDYHTAVTIAGRVARAPEPPPHAYDMLQALRTNLHLPAPTKPKPEKKGGGKKSSGGKKGGAKKKKKR